MEQLAAPVDLVTEKTQALCRVELSPVHVLGVAAAASVASTFASIPFEVAAHTLSQSDTLLHLGLIKQPFPGLWAALRHTMSATGGLRKTLNVARSLKFGRSAFSPTQPAIFTLKEMYVRAWALPLHPAYVPPQSDQVWTQWMAPHFLSGGLAGFTYSALLYSSTLMHTFIGKHFAGGRTNLPMVLDTEGWPRIAQSPGLPLPRQYWVTGIPFTLHRFFYHGVYDSVGPRNIAGAVVVGLAVSYISSAVGDIALGITRVLSGNRPLVRHGFAATRKGRLVRSVPGGLALAFYDQYIRMYCTVSSPSAR